MHHIIQILLFYKALNHKKCNYIYSDFNVLCHYYKRHSLPLSVKYMYLHYIGNLRNLSEKLILYRTVFEKR